MLEYKPPRVPDTLSGVKMYAELKRIVCESCGKEKPVRFYKTAKKCNDCAKLDWAANKAKRRRQKRKDDPKKHSRADFVNDLKKNYGLTIERFNAMYEDQKGCCACCGKHESDFKRGLHVDHDHETGQVRALLCTRCNPGLGYFGDSIELLEMAVLYLKKFKK
jgi:hypothetical protein